MGAVERGVGAAQVVEGSWHLSPPCPQGRLMVGIQVEEV